MTNYPTQPTMSSVFFVNWVFNTVPAVMMIIGIIRRNTSDTFSVKWYGGTMFTYGKATRAAVMPRFDGFMKWRIRPLMGARSTYFPPTPTTVPKAIGRNRSFAYSSMFTASAVMCVGSRKVYRPHMPFPEYPGARLPAHADRVSAVSSTAYPTASANSGQVHGCSNPRTVYPRMLKTLIEMAKLRSARYRGSRLSTRGGAGGRLVSTGAADTGAMAALPFGRAPPFDPASTADVSICWTSVMAPVPPARAR